MIDLNRENIDGFNVREFYVDLLRDLKQQVFFEEKAREKTGISGFTKIFLFHRGFLLAKWEKIGYNNPVQ